MTQELVDILFKALEASRVWQGYRWEYIPTIDLEVESDARREFAEYLANAIKDSTSADPS